MNGRYSRADYKSLYEHWKTEATRLQGQLSEKNESIDAAIDLFDLREKYPDVVPDGLIFNNGSWYSDSNGTRWVGRDYTQYGRVPFEEDLKLAKAGVKTKAARKRLGL